MEFRLVYRGPLKSQGGNKLQDKQVLRRYFRPQLEELWRHDPLIHIMNHMISGPRCAIEEVDCFRFLPVVSNKIDTVCEIDVLFLRPSPPGQLISHGGDLDNRMKRLIDGLRVPKTGELPEHDTPRLDESPFHCLLQDDALVTTLSVRSDRLLAPRNLDDVELVVHVKVKASRKTAFLMGVID